MIKRSIFPFLLICLIIIACDPNRVYENNIELERRTWIADSIINFRFEIEDSTQRYNIYYNLRNSVAYPFQNIYVNYTLEDSVGAEIAQDLVNRPLFHPKTGKPYGDGGLGDVFDHQFLLMEKYRFSRPGAYNLKLQQFMRRDSLPEVISVGVRVEKASNDLQGTKTIDQSK